MTKRTHESIEEFLLALTAAFERDDVDFFWRYTLPNSTNQHDTEVAFHRARVDRKDVSDAKRRESSVWLADAYRPVTQENQDDCVESKNDHASRKTVTNATKGEMRCLISF